MNLFQEEMYVWIVGVISALVLAHYFGNKFKEKLWEQVLSIRLAGAFARAQLKGEVTFWKLQFGPWKSLPLPC